MVGCPDEGHRASLKKIRLEQRVIIIVAREAGWGGSDNVVVCRCVLRFSVSAEAWKFPAGSLPVRVFLRSGFLRGVLPPRRRAELGGGAGLVFLGRWTGQRGVADTRRRPFCGGRGSVGGGRWTAGTQRWTKVDRLPKTAQQ